MQGEPEVTHKGTFCTTVRFEEVIRAVHEVASYSSMTCIQQHDMHGTSSRSGQRLALVDAAR